MMPITYEIDREKRLMTSRAAGRITSAELFDYLEAIIKDPANVDCDELVVLDDVDTDTDAISSADVRTAAQRAASLSRDTDFRVAVVAPRDADFGMFRMFQAFRELGEDRMAVFRDIQDACGWLGVKVP